MGATRLISGAISTSASSARLFDTIQIPVYTRLHLQVSNNYYYIFYTAYIFIVMQSYIHL